MYYWPIEGSQSVGLLKLSKVWHTQMPLLREHIEVKEGVANSMVKMTISKFNVISKEVSHF